MVNILNLESGINYNSVASDISMSTKNIYGKWSDFGKE